MLRLVLPLNAVGWSDFKSPALELAEAGFGRRLATEASHFIFAFPATALGDRMPSRFRVFFGFSVLA